MIVFRHTMDAHSFDVVREHGSYGSINRLGRSPQGLVAMLQWHPGSPPRVVVVHDYSSFTLDELVEMMAKLKEMSRG